MILLDLNIGIKLDNTKELLDFIKSENADICTFQEAMNAVDDSCFAVFKSKNDIVKFLLRNTLKSVEEAFSSIGLIRCHRFYVVNSKKVSLLRKTKEGLVLELATDTACEIPVSKTYLSKVADFFTS